MKLKTYVKHCIMQYPTLYHNALDVYNHLFYLIGNGCEWKNGTLQRIGFKTKTKKECVDNIVKDGIDTYNNFYKDVQPGDGIKQHIIDDFKIFGYKRVCKEILENIEKVENAETLAETIAPYDGFKFYPLSEYSKCMQIPDDIQPDWLEGINMINEFRKQHPELEDDFNIKTSQK